VSERVSIVIVNWKTPRLLSACLDSIASDPQSSAFEIWVVDNASGDESLDMLAKHYPYVRVVANDENVGFPRACNQVIPLADAPYVLLLNPDTIVEAGAISKLADYLDAHADTAAVGPKILNADGTLQLACRRSFPSPMAALYRLTYLSWLFPANRKLSEYNLTYADPDQELDVDVLSGSCMMVRKSAIATIGLLDEVMFAEDIDFCWRLKQTGARVVYNPVAVVVHYHGASSRLRPVGATITLHKGMAHFYGKHLAPKYHPLFNLAVYAGICLRAFVFVVLAWAKSLGGAKPLPAVDQPVSTAAKKEAAGVGQ
jgi:GT2 family glycosyltransferase